MKSDELKIAQPGEIANFKRDFCGSQFDTEEALLRQEQTCKGDEMPLEFNEERS